MPLELLPAVDVANGQAVRLVQGEAGSETDYGDPLAAALTWQEQGAQWIHLVDLDAAFGRGSNAELLAQVVGALDVAVEMSGGIRDDESLASALATGCRRVNIGTAALEQPEWCAKVIAEYGDAVERTDLHPRIAARYVQAFDRALGEDAHTGPVDLEVPPSARKGAAVKRGNANLAQVEQVRKFILLDRDFSQEEGEMTPTMKVKRAELERKLERTFDRIYDEPGFALEPT